MSEQPPADLSSASYVPVCAIGASAGGVGALQTLFRLLPDDLGLAYVVVVHLSPDHPSAMHEIIGACTKMPVHQVTDGPKLRANCVYVIAPDSELVINGDDVQSRPFSDPRSRRAPIDMFFRSIAAGRGDGIAVVLTGAGSDGALGVRAIKEAGGIVMVQEPAEAGFASMPQNAIATGVADVVAPLARLAERIVEAAHSKEAVRSLDENGAANDIRRIVAFLRTRTGHDFSGYKRSTVLRRIQRRMQVCQIASPADYLQYLRTNPEEAKELLSDLLISVTMFFRDPETFITLSHRVIRPLLESRSAGEAEDEFRAWVVGCATGEEAYSLAILLLEEAEQLNVSVPIQIFATDLDEGALATAREGRYPRSVEADVSAERLRRFFVDEGTHYRIDRQVRDLVLFATHSVVREPPFMRLDLITCRNVLIYLERALQSHVISVFRYGLKPDGYLFLGTAEAADTSDNQFTVVDREARIYRALPARPDFAPTLVAPGAWSAGRPALTESRLATARLDAGEVLGESHAAALEVSAPPSALVDAEQAVLHLSPTAGRFILLSAGPLSGRLPRIVRPELRLDLKLALDRVFDGRQPTITRPLRVVMEGETRQILLHVAPLPISEGTAPRAVVYFLDSGPGRTDGAEESPPPDELQHLHSELKAAQEAELAGRIRNEIAVQELRASNEELQSLNEEYRSTAEELETSKEELQSINEELQTVNAELKSKLGIISAAHNDLQNLTASSEIGTLFLDLHLRIRMFTPPVAELINVVDADVGRPVTNFTHRLDYDDIAGDARRVLRDLVPFEKEVRTVDRRWFVVRIRPYRTIEGKVEGAVVTFDDSTERKASETALRQSKKVRDLALAAAEMGTWSYDLVAGVCHFDARAQEMYGLPLDGLDHRPDGVAVVVHPDDTGPMFDAIRHASDVEGDGRYGIDYRIAQGNGTYRWLRAWGKAEFEGEGTARRAVRIVGASRDVTAEKEVEAALRESETRFRTLAETAPALIWQNDAAGANLFVNRYFLDYTGLSAGEIDGEKWRALVHPDDAEAYVADYMAAVTEQRPFHNRNRIRRHDGAWRWFENYAQPLFNQQGRYGGHVGVSTDVTANTEAELTLREGEERQAFLLRLSDALRPLNDPVAIQSTAMEMIGAHLRVNRAFYGEASSDHDTPVISPGYSHGTFPLEGAVRLPDFEPDMVASYRAGQTYVIEDTEQDARFGENTRASLRTAAVRAAVGVPLVKDGQVRAVVSLHQAVPRRWTSTEIALFEEAAERTWAAMERARAEEALRASVERFRALATTGGNSIYHMSPDWRLMYQLDSDTLEPTPEPIEDWVEKYIPAEDLPAVRAAIAKAIRTKSLFELEHRVRQADGSVGWVLSRAVPLLGPNGGIAGWFGAGSDVTDRRRAVERLRESEARYHALFFASPVPFMVLAANPPDFTITAANDAYFAATLTTRETLIGRRLFDAFPDDPSRPGQLGSEALAVSLDRVLATGRTDAMERVRYDISTPDGGFEPHWWLAINAPLFDASGAITAIIHQVDRQTELQRAEEAQRESEQRQQLLIEGVPQLVWRAFDGGQWTWASPQWTTYTGQADADSHGYGWLDPVHPDDRERVKEVWSAAIASGEFHADYRILHVAEGRYRWFQARATPARNAAGDIVEWLGTSTDVDDLRQLQERQGVLVAELQHRTRNLITVVRAVSQQTLREAESLNDFRDRFGNRLSALSRVQGLLSHLSAGQRVTFDDLLGSELAALGAPGGKVTLDGPADVPLRSATVQTFSLALHELATNALKYGALAAADGHLTVRWRAMVAGDGASWLRVDWRETGVDMTQVGEQPRGGGYGRELIEQALPYQLGAKTSYEMTQEGVRCVIDVPTSATTA